MPDQISNYRQIRLVLQVPHTAGGRTYFSLHAIGVRRGIPTATILADGVVAGLPGRPTVEEVWEAIDAACRQHMLSE